MAKKHLLIVFGLVFVLTGCESWYKWTSSNREDRLKREFALNVDLTKGELNDVEEAFTFFRNHAKEKNRFGHLSQYYLGVCYYRLNELAASERAFELYMEIAPDGGKVEETRAYLEKLRNILQRDTSSKKKAPQ